jgi:hypothetical protein
MKKPKTSLTTKMTTERSLGSESGRGLLCRAARRRPLNGLREPTQGKSRSYRRRRF